MCLLAMSIPHHETNDGAASNGRLVLARAEESVRFRPGGEGGNDVVNDGAIGDSVPRA